MAVGESEHSGIVRVVGCALVVTDFVRKCVVGGRLAVMGNDAESEALEVVVRVAFVRRKPSDAADLLGVDL